MLKSIALLSVAIALATSAPAQSTFMGISLDRPLQDSVPNVCPADVDMLKNVAPAGGMCVYPTAIAGDWLILGNKLGAFSVHLERGVAVAVKFNFPSYNNEVNRVGLEQKMGPPTKIEDRTVQNGMGAQYIDHYEVWHTDTTMVTYDSVGRNVQTGTITAYLKRYLEELDSRDKSQKASAAASF